MYLNVRLIVELSCVVPAQEVQVFKHLLNYNVAIHISTVKIKLECGPMPNVMVALPNIGGALCSTPQSLKFG